MKEVFNYTIERHIAVLSRSTNTTRELNLVSYNGSPAKYDIRGWNRTGEKAILYKGITLTKEEAKALKKALDSVEEL